MSRQVSSENLSKHREAKSVTPSQISAKTFNQEKVIKEESLNHLGHGNNSSPNVKILTEQPQFVSRDRQTSLVLDSIRHENEVMPDFSWHDIVKTSSNKIDRKTSTDDNKSDRKVQIPPTRRVSKLDLSDSELQKILSEKHRKDSLEGASSNEQRRTDNIERAMSKINVEDSDLFYFNSVQIVSNLSCQLADEILNSICHQMIDSDLISKLISDELKG